MLKCISQPWGRLIHIIPSWLDFVMEGHAVLSCIEIRVGASLVRQKYLIDQLLASAHVFVCLLHVCASVVPSLGHGRVFSFGQAGP